MRKSSVALFAGVQGHIVDGPEPAISPDPPTNQRLLSMKVMPPLMGPMMKELLA
jgi:hypothetical protein